MSITHLLIGRIQVPIRPPGPAFTWVASTACDSGRNVLRPDTDSMSFEADQLLAQAAADSARDDVADRVDTVHGRGRENHRNRFGF